MNFESTSNRPINHNTSGSKEGVDSNKIFFLMLANWYWFAFAVALAFLGAMLYNHFSPPKWRISATILIGEDRTDSPLAETDHLLKGFGLLPGMQNLDNQLHILTSRSIIDQTLNDLPFDVEYYRKKLMNDVALYPESPIQVYTSIGGGIPMDVDFKFKLKDEDTYNLAAKSEDTFNINLDATFGETIDINGGSIKIEETSKSFAGKNGSNTIYFVHNSRENLIEGYRSRLRAEPVSKESSIINLSIEGTNKLKDEVFLSKLVDVFVNNNLDRKNMEAERTIQFINDQLAGISDSLSITEDRLQQFRSRNKVMDISAQGQLIIDQAMNLENERARLIIESDYYDYLAGYISKDVAGELPISPATIGITDPALTKLVLDLSDLQSQYFSKSLGDKNPMQSQIAQQLYNTRNALNETLKGVMHANELAIKENAKQIRSVNARAAALPKTERQLLGIQREYKLNDELYSFLLQKHAEAQIQKASNSPDNEVIDYPEPGDKPIAPIPGLTYLIALLVGIGIPSISIIVSQAWKNVIKNEDEVKKITDLPIAGRIPHSKNRTQRAVLDEPFSPLAESFRALRAKIQFFTQGIKTPVILVTSSMPEEGKSFAAINLASVYSMMGKKTLLIGFDLRRPVTFTDLNIADEKGLSTWYINGELEIIELSSHLDVLPSGPQPPNPAELIESPNTKALINKLREKYDFIIIDSAPIGTVVDSVSLASIADTTILLVRFGKTVAPLLSHTISDVKANGITNVCLLLNDIQYGRIRSRYYGTYRYDNKYFSKTRSNNLITGTWLQKIKAIRRTKPESSKQEI
jgi:capsular exopolysaccharide synthesis family protein